MGILATRALEREFFLKKESVLCFGGIFLVVCEIVGVRFKQRSLGVVVFSEQFIF